MVREKNMFVCGSCLHLDTEITVYPLMVQSHICVHREKQHGTKGYCNVYTIQSCTCPYAVLGEVGISSFKVYSLALS